MKEHLDNESIRSLVAYRIQRSHETMEEARYMLEGGYCNAAINRIYYASFYAVMASLLNNDIQAQSHKGVKAMLGLHFVANGKLSAKLGAVYSTLFEKRHSNDYDDFVYCDPEMAKELLPQADEFVQAIEQLID